MNVSRPERALIVTILVLALLVSYVQVYKAGQRDGFNVYQDKLEAVSEAYAEKEGCHG